MILKIFKNNSYAIYLGTSLYTFARIDYLQWEFYAIAIPVIILANWKAL